LSNGPQFLDEPSKPKNEDASEPPLENARGWVEGAVGVKEVVRPGPIETIAPRPARAGNSALYKGSVALLILIAGISSLEVANFAVTQFERAIWLGWLSVAIIVPTALVLIWSILREWHGYFALASMEQLQKGLASQDLAVARANASKWLTMIEASGDIRKSIDTASDASTLRAILAAGPLAQIEQETAEAARAAAVQVVVATAVSPWPAFDGVIVVWRSLKLVREVAQKHGLRPGAVGTLRLFHRVTLDAGLVVGTEVTVTALTEALLNSSVVGGLVGQAAGSAVAARRMFRLAFAVARVTRPL
jgi:putative membrane protein